MTEEEKAADGLGSYNLAISTLRQRHLSERTIAETHRGLEALFKACMANYSRIPAEVKKAVDQIVAAAGRE